MEHVSDVVWLPREDSRVPPTWRTQDDAIVKTAKQWKDSGNKALETGKLHEAVECYNDALRVAATSEEAQVIKLNRSLVNLK